MTDRGRTGRSPDGNPHGTDRTDVGAAVQTRTRITRWLLSPLGLLVLVGVFYCLAQLALFDESRFLEWDEAVYIGKASRRFQQPEWSVHRALGVPWLLSPAFVISSSFVWMRWYLVIASTLAVALGFGAWLKPAGRLAPAAMLVFSTSWLALFYGSEASPNLYVAAASVGACGSLIGYLSSHALKHLGGLAAGVSLAVLFRPSDGLVLGVVLALYGAAVAARHRWHVAAAIGTATGVAIAVGLVPWVVDAFMHFGGPLTRWTAASEMVGGSLDWRLPDHLRLLDGPLMGPERQAGLPTVAVVILLASVVVACFGIAAHRGRSAPSLALVVSLGLAAPYLLYVGTFAPRFLLPTYALLSIAVCYGVLAAIRAHRPSGLILVAGLAVVGLASIAKAQSVEQEQRQARLELVEVGDKIAQLSDDRACLVLAQYAHPQLTIASGCDGDPVTPDSAACRVAEVEDPDIVVIVSLVGTVPPSLAAAQIGDPLPGPSGWVTLRIDPALADCDA